MSEHPITCLEIDSRTPAKALLLTVPFSFLLPKLFFMNLKSLCFKLSTMVVDLLASVALVRL